MQAADFAQVVKAAVDIVRVTAEAKSITLVDIIDPSVSLIAGDPKRLEQIVWNLLSNAVKFTPKGGKVQVRLERNNSHVEIVVADNGQGIAPQSLSHIFDRFWQEKQSFKYVRRGPWPFDSQRARNPSWWHRVGAQRWPWQREHLYSEAAYTCKYSTIAGATQTSDSCTELQCCRRITARRNFDTSGR